MRRYETVYSWMDQNLLVIMECVPQPKKVTINDSYCFAYTEQTLKQAILQKLSRIISGLRASENLLDAGFLQEQASLCRMLEEFSEDVLFLSFGVIDEQATERHVQYLKAFYPEIRDGSISASAIFEPKQLVARKKIRAYIANHKMTGGNPSGSILSSLKIASAFSGYVHGASVNIMEMYHPTPPRYWTSGMESTSRQTEHWSDFHSFVYRSLMSFIMVASAVSRGATWDKSFEFLLSFEQEYGKVE